MQVNAATDAPRHTLRSPSDEAELFSQPPQQSRAGADGDRQQLNGGDVQGSASIESVRNCEWRLELQTLPCHLADLAAETRRRIFVCDQRSQLARSPEQPLKTPFSEAFTLGPLLGKGAYAPVHLAVHRVRLQLKSNVKTLCLSLQLLVPPATRLLQSTGKSLAVKIYEGFRQLERERRALITREVQIMRRLHHENIVKYGGMFNEATALYIVMQHLSGGSLHGMVRSHPKGKLPESAAKKLFYDVVKGVNYLHSQSIVHRDLKLENMLLDEKGRVRLIDFGFATLLKPGVKCRMACGTPSYMPPEILKKGAYEGTAADMWSLGVVLYAMLHGCYPFRAQQPKELYQKISAGEFSLAQTLSAEAKLLLQGLLTLNPEDRLTAQQTLVHPWLQAVADGGANSELSSTRRGTGAPLSNQTAAAQRTNSSLHLGMRGTTNEELQALAGPALPNTAPGKPFGKGPPAGSAKTETAAPSSTSQQTHAHHHAYSRLTAASTNRGKQVGGTVATGRRDEPVDATEKKRSLAAENTSAAVGNAALAEGPTRGGATSQQQPYSRLFTKVKEFFASPSSRNGAKTHAKETVANNNNPSHQPRRGSSGSPPSSHS